MVKIENRLIKLILKPIISEDINYDDYCLEHEIYH